MKPSAPTPRRPRRSSRRRSRTRRRAPARTTRSRIGALLDRHSQEVQACYEATLAANPKLAGTVTLNLETDQTGVIKGVSTDPKAGLADLSAVAGCVAEHARSWKLPKRGTAGTTRIKLTYAMSLRK